MSDDVPSIHDWVGGTEAIGRWLNAFYDEVERDELLSPVFGGMVTREHREHVTVEHAPVPRWGWGVAPPYGLD
jgi:hemoglobin